MDNETREVGEVEKSSGKLAEEINVEYRAFERDFKSATEHALRCGVLLEEKKASLSHGEWLPWLREHFEGSERHAQRFMKLAREQGALDPTRVSDLSLRGALRELPSNAPSVADRIADEWEWDDEDRREFAALPEREKALLLRSNLLFKYMVIGV